MKNKSFQKFRDTGRFNTVESFLKEHPKVRLHRDTTEVVVYEGGYFIEVRKPDTFFFDNYESRVLDDVERALWEKKVVNNLNNK